MEEEWTGEIHRPLKVWKNPSLSDDIYLHFSEVLKDVKMVSSQIRGRVLDVGAGKSPYREFFTEAKEYVKLDNRKYNGIDIKADITKRLPIVSNSFDSVVCIQVLEHVGKPQNVINEIYRVLKKNGKCFLTTHMAAPLHGEPYDYYRFTKYALKDLFKEFSGVQIKESGGASLSIVQLIVWGVSEKLPVLLSKPLIFLLNIFGKVLDRLFYSPVFTINYSVLATK